jgi:hypothetical protein
MKYQKRQKIGLCVNTHLIRLFGDFLPVRKPVVSLLRFEKSFSVAVFLIFRFHCSKLLWSDVENHFRSTLIYTKRQSITR